MTEAEASRREQWMNEQMVSDPEFRRSVMLTIGHLKIENMVLTALLTAVLIAGILLFATGKVH